MIEYPIKIDIISSFLTFYKTKRIKKDKQNIK